MLKAMTLNGALWRYLKRCFGSWNCLENVESKEAKWCVLTLFEMLFWKLELSDVFILFINLLLKSDFPLQIM